MADKKKIKRQDKIDNLSVVASSLEDCVKPWNTYRERMINQKLELEKQIDKTVFAISSGALGISLAFLDKISPEKHGSWLYVLLGLGWLLMVGTIVLQALSFVNTVKQIRESIVMVEGVINSPTISVLATKEQDFYKSWEKKNKKIGRFDNTSFIAMIVGIAFILLFAFLSLFSKGENNSRKIELTLSDSLTNKILIMSDEQKKQQGGQDSSKQVPEKKQEKFHDLNEGADRQGNQKGQMDSGKQHQQIINPPITTKPKDK